MTGLRGKASEANVNGQKKSASTTRATSKPKKRKRVEKNKGLRHFSMKVCKKVEEKGTTTYNEVADELVLEFAEQRRLEGVAALHDNSNLDDNGKKRKKKKSYDEKNIRRRVYDALNVLMAMEIISKDRKAITWKGLPRSSPRHELASLTEEHQKVKLRVQEKRTLLAELLQQQIAFKNLVDRNVILQEQDINNSVKLSNKDEVIPLPFIVVAACKDTVIRCEMSDDRGDIFFNFDNPFEIHDDNEILQNLGLHTMDEAKLKSLIPSDLWPYLPANICTPPFPN